MHMYMHLWYRAGGAAQDKQLLAIWSLLHPSTDPACVPQEEQGGSSIFQARAQRWPEVECTEACACGPLGLHCSAEASEVFACPLPA